MRKQALSIFILVIIAYAAPSHAMNVAVRISDQHTEVVGGDRLYFEIDIKYPENPSRKDLRLEYRIVKPLREGERGGEAIASQNVLRAVETQASFLDYIVVPESVASGEYELVIVVRDYEKLNKEVSATFRVLKGREQVVAYFFILLGAITLVAALVIFHIISERKRTRQV